MNASIFNSQGPISEPSQLVSFAHNQLDRQSEHRPDGVLEDAMQTEGAKFICFSDGQVVSKEGEMFLRKSAIDWLEPDLENAALLGWDDDNVPYIVTSVAREEFPDHVSLLHPREIYSQGLVNDQMLGILAQGASIHAWVNTNKYCGYCGSKTEPKAGGYNRHCPNCGRTHFPRVDPVVIMLVIDEENECCLLGRSPHFTVNMYSALAGFLEPGETIEDAVRRETLEESGIKVGAIRYHASQPWPMPHTLMIGCFAQAINSEISFDSEELADCRWFSKDEVRQRLNFTDGDERQSPPEGAIAHRLMRDWVDWAY